MNKQQVKGRYEVAKGKVKEVAGQVTGNGKLEIEGKIQKNAGKVRAGVGDVAAEVEDVAAEVKNDS
ncbi:MAG: CsbD family protein [Thiohalocapsa sp.]